MGLFIDSLHHGDLVPLEPHPLQQGPAPPFLGLAGGFLVLLQSTRGLSGPVFHVLSARSAWVRCLFTLCLWRRP